MTWSLVNVSYRMGSATPAITNAGCIEAMTLASASSHGGSGGVSVHWPWKYGKWHGSCTVDPLLLSGPSRLTNLRPYSSQYLLTSVLNACIDSHCCSSGAAGPFLPT